MDLARSEIGLFTASGNSGVYYSDNSGDDWQYISNNAPDLCARSVAYSDGTLYVGTWGGDIVSTSDMGDNWDKIYQAQSDSAYVVQILVYEDNIFFAHHLNMDYFNTSIIYPKANRLNVIKTNGEYYADISYNAASRIITDMGLKEDTLIASSSSGLYKMAISEIERLSVDDENLTDEILFTANPYPTPANDEINIEISSDLVLGIDNAEIGIYDILGNKICGKESLIINKTSGSSRVITWKASGVAPGVYFMNIKIEEQNRSVKLLLE